MPRRPLSHNPVSRIGKMSTTDELIAIMREEEELAEQKKILQKMSPECREKCEVIRRLVGSEIQSILRNRHTLGEHLVEIYNDETSNGAKVYGKHAIQNISKILGLDDSFVRGCMKFAQLYTREGLEQLCAALLPRGEPLSWSHVRCLLQVEDKTKREELLQKTLDDGLTCDDLAYEVKRLHDAKNGNRGRPPKIPSGFDGIVQQQKQLAENWDRRYLKIWVEPTHSFVTKAAELAADEVTEARLKEAAELAHQLRSMADQATRAAEKAEGVVRDFERILADRKAGASTGPRN